MYLKIKLCFCKLMFLSISTSALAHQYNVYEADAKYRELELYEPEPQQDGRIMTLNGKGAMFPVLNEATIEFIEYTNGKKVLEIGGAYGNVMIKTLSKYKNVEYHLFDLSESHLAIAAHNLLKADLDKSSIDKVRFLSGDITNDIEINDKYDAILISHVMHFFNPDQLKSSTDNIHKLLKTKGRVYVIAVSPYTKRYESLIPDYEKRLKNGDEFPGFVESRRPYMNNNVINKIEQDTIDDQGFMFLDDIVLKRLFEQHGFKIIKCSLRPIGFESKTYQLDGREYVVMVAEKQT